MVTRKKHKERDTGWSELFRKLPKGGVVYINMTQAQASGIICKLDCNFKVADKWLVDIDNKQLTKITMVTKLKEEK